MATRLQIQLSTINHPKVEVELSKKLPLAPLTAEMRINIVEWGDESDPILGDLDYVDFEFDTIVHESGNILLSYDFDLYEESAKEPNRAQMLQRALHLCQIPHYIIFG